MAPYEHASVMLCGDVLSGAAHSFQQALNLNPGDRVLRQVGASMLLTLHLLACPTQVNHDKLQHGDQLMYALLVSCQEGNCQADMHMDCILK